MPINILAGIGGMSEFSMMTQGVPWPVAYASFTAGMALVGWLTYLTIKHYERKKARRNREAGRLQKEAPKTQLARSL
jgi:magnesium transporter